MGTAAGFTLHATRAWDITGAMGLGGAVAGALMAWAAVRMDRARVSALPLPDGQVWPVHGAVYAVPLVAMMPAIVWLGVLVAVDSMAAAPVVVAGAAVIGLCWGLTRVWSDHRLVVGLQALTRDDAAGARHALQALAQHPLATKRARSSARENLAILLLSDGELSAAAHWFGKVDGSASALAGLAIAQAGLGQIDVARDALERARTAPGTRRAQAEIDAARVLVLWKTEGADAALELAEGLDNPASGPLFRGLLRALRGDPPPDRSPLLRALVP